MSIESGPKRPTQETSEEVSKETSDEVSKGEGEKTSGERLPKSVEELLSATTLDKAEGEEQLSHLYSQKIERAQIEVGKFERAINDAKAAGLNPEKDEQLMRNYEQAKGTLQELQDKLTATESKESIALNELKKQHEHAKAGLDELIEKETALEGSGDTEEVKEKLSRLYNSKREAAQAGLAKIEQAIRDIETSR